MQFQPTVIQEIATTTNFNEAGYLRANPDVAEAVRAGSIPPGRVHFERHGRSESRIQAPAIDLTELRRAKLDRLRPHVRWELDHLNAPYCSNLSREKQLELACATVLTATKPIR